MCNQTVGLVAGEIEHHGITTVAIQLLETVTRAVGPPRALLAPFNHGYPLDRPNEPVRQRRVLEAALRLAVEAEGPPPVLSELKI